MCYAHETMICIIVIYDKLFIGGAAYEKYKRRVTVRYY